MSIEIRRAHEGSEPLAWSALRKGKHEEKFGHNFRRL